MKRRPPHRKCYFRKVPILFMFDNDVQIKNRAKNSLNFASTLFNMAPNIVCNLEVSTGDVYLLTYPQAYSK